MIVAGVALLIVAYLAISASNYDLSHVKGKDGCYSYKSDDDAIFVAALMIKNKFGDAELKHQRRLFIYHQDSTEIGVSGSPLSAKLFMFGGGAAIVDFDKIGGCLALHQIYKEK